LKTPHLLKLATKVVNGVFVPYNNTQNFIGLVIDKNLVNMLCLALCKSWLIITMT